MTFVGVGILSSMLLDITSFGFDFLKFAWRKNKICNLGNVSAQYACDSQGVLLLENPLSNRKRIYDKSSLRRARYEPK